MYSSEVNFGMHPFTWSMWVVHTVRNDRNRRAPSARLEHFMVLRNDMTYLKIENKTISSSVRLPNDIHFYKRKNHQLAAYRPLQSFSCFYFNRCNERILRSGWKWCWTFQLFLTAQAAEVLSRWDDEMISILIPTNNSVWSRFQQWN